MSFPITVHLIGLHMHNTYFKRPAISFDINMIVAPIKIYTVLSIDIHFSLNYTTVFTYSEVHI